ncbi:LysR family transcriptional regulator [Litoreibacter halocynthiae]|uniref:LysR family transcriptional regulator n=1 Tax=Litoreibacter halocynthiae TaxID=1242689 RepID=A0A4R7LKX3_9RHOB|nr:LysR family transcriptional regulator [Litoreibacter halocynthiae]
MEIDNWDEYRTAYQVARLRTVSAAAEVLGVHHATVIRHIDSLEGKLGAKLFQRHARGYTPTEAGEDLLTVAAATEDQLTQLAGRIHGRGASVSGDLIVTCLPQMSPLMARTIAKYQADNPEIRAELIVDTRPLRLEYGEAHVALRAGAPGDDLDNIVQELAKMPMGLFAHKDYVFRHGPLKGIDDIPNHRFCRMSTLNPRAPFMRWMGENVPEENVVYKCSDSNTVQDGVIAGAGIGFLPSYIGNAHPDMKEMLPSEQSWSSTFWCVTHVDLHRTAKVHSFVTFLKEEAKGWGDL